MTLNKAEELELRDIASKYGITVEEAKEIIQSMYSFIREKIMEIDFREKELSREDIDNMKTNFNLSCIGKLCVNYNLYKRVNKSKIDKNG